MEAEITLQNECWGDWNMTYSARDGFTRYEAIIKCTTMTQATAVVTKFCKMVSQFPHKSVIVRGGRARRAGEQSVEYDPVDFVELQQLIHEMLGCPLVTETVEETKRAPEFDRVISDLRAYLEAGLSTPELNAITPKQKRKLLAFVENNLGHGVGVYDSDELALAVRKEFSN